MNDIADRLLYLKKTIAKKRQRLDKMKGVRSVTAKKLKKQYSVTSPKEAKVLLASLKEKQEKMEENLESLLDALEDTCDNGNT